MIKFFRKIRQKLLTENRFSKYLLYAIGEIVLVVIGILIALQINNWNTNRIAENQMTAYLINLKNDLQTDTTNLSKNIRSYKKFIADKQLIKLTNFKNIPTDSLAKSVIPWHNLYIPVQTTFDKLINSGITQISNNDTLSQIVYYYYTTNLLHIKTMNTYEGEQTSKDGNYWFREQDLFELDYPDMPNFQDDKESRSNLIKLLSTTKTRNNLKEALNRKTRMLDTYQNLKKFALYLLIEIEKELEKR